MKIKHSVSSKFALLVILFISFIIKYHTNTFKSKKRSLSFPFNHSIISTTKSSIIPASLLSTSRVSRTSNEKYITFFTHSGFQNQLIQVENGILLAWYLNRTLILPKALLGEAFGWNQFSKLYQHHTYRDTTNNYCQQFKSKKSRKSASCPDPSKYALASFDDLFDLNWAKQHVKIIEREQSDFNWLKDTFGIETNNRDIQTGTYVDGDVLFYKDETRYDWRIYDQPVKHRFLGRYNDSLDITQLQNHTQKLIHFTSLFGTGKFPIKKPENMVFFEQLKNSIKYKHPAVLKMTEIVVEALGGAGNFVGTHLRTADGLFIDAIPDNIQHLISSIPNSNQQIPNSDKLSTCVALAKQNNTKLVFLATDAVQPRNNTKFRDLWKHLPCTFTLAEILSDKDPLWSHMDQYRTSHTGQSMRKYLIPLIDALVASQGEKFVGTKGSTFSGYINRLHKSYWNA